MVRVYENAFYQPESAIAPTMFGFYEKYPLHYSMKDRGHPWKEDGSFYASCLVVVAVSLASTAFYRLWR